MTIPDLMSDDYKRPLFRRKRSRLLKWMFRLVLVLAIMLAVILGVLSLISGSSPELEEAFENHLSGSFKKDVTIEKLVGIEVFPIMSVDMEGLVVRSRPEQDNPEQDKEQPQQKPDDTTTGEAGAEQKPEQEKEEQKTVTDAEAAEEKPESPKETVTQARRPYDLKIDKFSMQISFWDLIFGIDSVRDLTVKGLHIPAQTPGDSALVIDRLELTPKAYTKPEGKILPGLVMTGAHGDRPMFAQINLATEMNRNQNITNYRLDRPSPFIVTYAQVKAAGVVRMLSQREIMLEKFVLRDDERDLMQGRLYHKAPKTDTPRIVKGEIKTGESVTDFDLAMRNEKEDTLLSGHVHIGPLRLKDFTGQDAVIPPILETLDSLTGGPGPTQDTAGEDSNDEDSKSKQETAQAQAITPLGAPYLDLDIRLEPVNAGNEKIGAIDFKVLKDKTSFQVTELEGSLSKGSVKGGYNFEVKENGASLNTSLEMLDVAYGEFQEALTDKSFAQGDADIHVTLSGQGVTQKDLRSSLQGRMSLIAGEGKLASSALNFWGGGLINALFPSKDKQSMSLNCALIDFKIENGIAEGQSLFMDTDVLQLVGKGKINLIEDKIELVLTPNPKKAAIMDVATAVNVTGSLYDPKISPNKLSLGKKVGGLILGAVNPALLIVSMTDFGLSEEHPCAETIHGLESEIEKEKARAQKTESQAQKSDPDNTDKGAQEKTETAQ